MGWREKDAAGRVYKALYMTTKKVLHFIQIDVLEDFKTQNLN